jgi:folate-dependent phosphoribosylglycinamide formyltransferase PurN
VRAILLTSTFLRHRYVANTLGAAIGLEAVWLEEKAFVPLRYARNARDEQVIARHFDTRDDAEARDFGVHRDLEAGCGDVHRVGAGGVNEPREIAAMEALAPDLVLVFGTGLLSRGITDRFGGRIVNLHLGLSPYYRGSGTSFWPLVNREPEYVGATIHYLDAGIDTGPIIAHVRPLIVAGDGPHDIGNKTIVAGAEALADAARAFGRAPLPATAQGAGGGRLYQRKDFSADAVLRLYEQFETGMIEEYLAHKAARDARIALRSLVTSA